MALVGLVIGTTLSKKIDGSKLKPAFGWFVLVKEFILLQNCFQIAKIKRNYLTYKKNKTIYK
jgi:uncharacterized membrane protein YfcA